MEPVDLLLFHRAPAPEDSPLTLLLQRARTALSERHEELFRRAGVDRVVRVEAGTGVATGATGATAGSFGEALADALSSWGISRAIILGDGAVPRLHLRDARRLVEAAAAPGRRALTNNRYSSDICAVSRAADLRHAPPLRNDNVLPRWLEEEAGFVVAELPARDRLALDLDSPLDLALLGLARDRPSFVGTFAEVRPRRRPAGSPRDPAPEPSSRIRPTTDPAAARVAVPRLEELRALAVDPRRELLVFGRSSAGTLAWLERNVRCRVRFLAEERGFKAGASLGLASRPGTEHADAPPRRAGGPGSSHLHAAPLRPARATLGRLLAFDGPGALAARVAELADGALLDTRVLLADRLGPLESGWPTPEDRYASDLLLAERVADPWLRDLTRSAATSPLPILLGGHTLVGPGVRLVCGRD